MTPPAPFDPRFFPVDDQLISWGSTLDEAEQQLAPRPWLPPHGGWPNLRSRCQAVLGLPAVECELRGPARHKPILQASYELAPPPNHPGPGPADPAYWVAPLTRVLGPPAEAGPNPHAYAGSGSVVYTARWEMPLLNVGLSVFGGVRQQEAGRASAGLYFDWRDVLTAARPFYEAALVQSAALAAEYAHLTLPPQRFDTRQRQGRYYDDPAPAGDAATQTRWRQSERALYREGLLETPPALQASLSATQLALWRVPTRAAWAVSTQHDTVLLPDAAPVPVELTTLRPAKGGGAMYLSLGELHLSDTYNAPALPQLATALERVGVAVERSEEYDC